MCSYLLIISKYQWEKSLLLNVNKKIKSRGPDNTNFKSIKINDLYVYAIHNLLDISGKGIIQPLIDDKKIMLYNGEIYSPKKKDLADTNLLFNNIKSGNFSNYLRKSIGEFALTYLDKIKYEINIFTDLIGTKPVYFSIKSGAIAIASYGSSLEELQFNQIEEVKPNSHIKISFKNFGNIKTTKENLYKINLEQNINNFDAWNKSFLRSLNDRVVHFDTKIFVPLSSGYDSGAICAGLNFLEIPYFTISIGEVENKKIMRQRININKKASCEKHYQLSSITHKDSKKISNLILNKLGYVFFDHIDAPNTNPTMLHQDSGAIALYKICEYMKKLGFNSLMSGSGADEIYSDYGFRGKKMASHSEFGGLFPESLEKFFPWKKFYSDSQRSYLKKDEMISSIFGIEGRYPYLDSELTQKFISLSSNLKNSKYKNCIANFLDKHNYPYEKNVKIGFSGNKVSKIIKVKKKIREILKFV